MTAYAGKRRDWVCAGPVIACFHFGRPAVGPSPVQVFGQRRCFGVPPLIVQCLNRAGLSLNIVTRPCCSRASMISFLDTVFTTRTLPLWRQANPLCGEENSGRMKKSRGACVIRRPLFSASVSSPKRVSTVCDTCAAGIFMIASNAMLPVAGQ